MRPRRRAGRDGNRGSRSSAHSDGSVEAMPLQNRVTPLSELVADPARGLVYGNRGCLHDDAAGSAAASRPGAGSPAGSSSRAGTASRCCSRASSPSSSSSTRRPPSPPDTGPARSAAARTTTASSSSSGEAGADEIDLRLHAERLDGTARRLHRAPRRRAARRRVRARRRRALARARRRAPALDACRLYRSHGGRRRGRGDHAADADEVLRSSWEPAVPLLHPTATRRS